MTTNNNIMVDLSVGTYPDNVLNSKRILGFRKRNIVEGIIFALIVGFIIYLIPFVPRVKIIFWAILCGAAFFGGLLGIANQTVTEYIYNFIKLKKNGRKYHFRQIQDNGKVKSSNNTPNTVLNESIADKALRIGKAYAKEHLQNYLNNH